jgi:hypothetical protein
MAKFLSILKPCKEESGQPSHDRWDGPIDPLIWLSERDILGVNLPGPTGAQRIIQKICISQPRYCGRTSLQYLIAGVSEETLKQR